jgi:hypothetical protein
MIRATSRPHAPWYVVPANHKWFTHLVVAEALVEALEKIDPQPPVVAGAALEELNAVRAALLAEEPDSAVARKPRSTPKAKKPRGR